MDQKVTEQTNKDEVKSDAVANPDRPPTRSSAVKGRQNIARWAKMLTLPAPEDAKD